MNFTNELSQQFNLKPWQIENVIALIDEGNTIPFIARYRKEAHGSLDDQMLREINDRLNYLRNLQKRCNEIQELILSQEKLTPEIQNALAAATTLTELEDIYRPFKPKRKTRASTAKEKGLEPLALKILAQEKCSASPIEMAKKFINPEKEVHTAENALNGAQDIIAEILSDDANLRKRLRTVAMAQSLLVARATDPENDSVYRQYYDFKGPVSKTPEHRILAINRGEKEKFLKVSIDFDKEKAMNIVYSVAVKEPSPCLECVKEAATDAYDRLIFPSIEREIRSSLSEAASEKAIKVFSVNLKYLLMQPPVKGKVAMGLDPGYRTGCKVAVVDKTGRVLDTNVIYPTHSEKKVAEGKKIIQDLIKKYGVEIIAIGNGTASKETEIFLADAISKLNENVSYMVVSEAGASVYSASKLAAEEFPNYDVTLRSAVSIARRLQDPLAELVKIDPKAIGVGQYQHDMPKKRLDETLGAVVEDCVNSVGIDLNTASPSLLSRVSGISPSVSKNIVAYREENGEFKSRNDLKKVSKLGPKVFQQCAGFLRVAESENILDNTSVHPEVYASARELLKVCGYNEDDVRKGNLSELENKVKNLGIEKIAEKINVGVPTLEDIIKELMRPGRDPRDTLPPPLLRKDVMDIKDLKPGMELMGTVRNVIDFGAFVDIGIHNDGLVHISQISDKYIKHPSDVVKIGDVVKVKVLDVDIDKHRISLTMK